MKAKDIFYSVESYGHILLKNKIDIDCVNDNTVTVEMQTNEPTDEVHLLQVLRQYSPIEFGNACAYKINMPQYRFDFFIRILKFLGFISK